MYDNEISVDSRAVSQKKSTKGQLNVGKVLRRYGNPVPNADLSTEEVVNAIKYLHRQELIKAAPSPTDQRATVYRPTAKGFEIAHELRTSNEREDWRGRSQRTNVLLMLATVVLAINAASELLNGVSVPLRPASVIAILLVGIAVGVMLGRWSV
jgi:DNA-binding PadR family transcriptional regulator